MREYAALLFLVFILVLMAASYVTNSVADAMDSMANTIAQGSHHD